MVPMDAKLNGASGDWYKLEQQWKKTLEAGGRVQVNIKPIYSGNSKRPDSFVINFSENGGREINRVLKNTPTGK
nr:DNA/RNA non-specific endonuclease [Neisseria yangbaofengii]